MIPVRGLPEVREGDDLAALIAAAAKLADGDIVVVAHKVVSKAEGRVVRLAEVEPSAQARDLAADEDPRRLEVILRESTRIVRTRPPLVIAETRHGFVCASAGVDASNAPEAETVVLLPEDPDASAARLRDRLRQLTGVLGAGIHGTEHRVMAVEFRAPGVVVRSRSARRALPLGFTRQPARAVPGAELLRVVPAHAGDGP